MIDFADPFSSLILMKMTNCSSILLSALLNDNPSEDAEGTMEADDMSEKEIIENNKHVIHTIDTMGGDWCIEQRETFKT